MAYDPDKACPIIPVEADYPYLLSTIRPDGSQEIRSIQPGKEAYRESEASGNYRAYDKDGNQVEVVVNNKHEYIKNNSITTIDGKHDLKIGESSYTQIGTDCYVETQNNHVTVAQGQIHTISLDSQIDVVQNGDKQIIVGNDMVINVSGNMNELVSGDVVTQTNGIRSETISRELLINSQTSITLKCGSSSIIMTPSGIKIVAPRVDFVQG
jgi:hypothetical protein